MSLFVFAAFSFNQSDVAGNETNFEYLIGDGTHAVMHHSAGREAVVSLVQNTGRGT